MGKIVGQEGILLYDMLLTLAIFLKLLLACVLFPFSLDEYYVDGKLEGYLVYGRKGNTLFLVECAITNEASGFMLYHRMKLRGVQEGLSHSLDYLCGGFGGEESKRMNGMYPIEGADFKGFSLRPFKLL